MATTGYYGGLSGFLGSYTTSATTDTGRRYQNIRGVQVPYGTQLSMSNFRDYVLSNIGSPQYRGSSKEDSIVDKPSGDILFRLRKETHDFIGDRKLN